jgi:hypothetical protein
MRRVRATRRSAFGICWTLVQLSVRAVALAWQVVFELLGFAARSCLVLYDVARARHSLPGGKLTCPRGHAVVTEGADVVFSCNQCGFVYEGGSAWICSNPECQAVTPYLNCACGLSIRNPYRYGRPS